MSSDHGHLRDVLSFGAHYFCRKNSKEAQSTTATRTLLTLLSLFLFTQVFGLSSVAQVVLGRGNTGHYLSINMAFGIGVTLGIYASRGVSGEQHTQAWGISKSHKGHMHWGQEEWGVEGGSALTPQKSTPRAPRQEKQKPGTRHAQHMYRILTPNLCSEL